MLMRKEGKWEKNQTNKNPAKTVEYTCFGGVRLGGEGKERWEANFILRLKVN